MKKCYPAGKTKSFNIAYDDGVLQDVPFVALLNRYGLKGTFNLNSRLMEEQFAWIHPNGMEVRRLSPEKACKLYAGHEVASHTLTHPYMDNLHGEELERQLREDKAALEALCGTEVRGFAVPFSYYSEEIARCAERCGFEYARMSEFSGVYTPCRDRYFWKTSIYHIEPRLTDFVAGFLNTEEELAVCQIVGHSYDLDAENLWGTMELICAAVAGRNDIWSCTNLELVRYLRAMENCVITAECIRNPSDTALWFSCGGKLLEVPPGETVRYRK